MPYIPKHQRAFLDPLIDALARKIAVGKNAARKGFAGFVNYAVTRLLLKLLGVTDLSWRPPHGTYDYDKINEAIGVLECCKLELYRRLAAPYENEKIADNGEVIEPPPYCSACGNSGMVQSGPCPSCERGTHKTPVEKCRHLRCAAVRRFHQMCWMCLDCREIMP